MSNTIESKGRSVEEAISEALLRTGWRRDEVDVTVLEQPKSGFLGLIGGKQAKVRVERKGGGGGDRRGRRDDARFGDRRGGRDRGQRDGRERDNRERAGGERDQRGGRAEAAGQARGEQTTGEGRRDGGRERDQRDRNQNDRGAGERSNADRDQRGGRGRDRDRERPRQDAGARGAAATVEPAGARTTGDEEGGRNPRRRRRRSSRTREDGAPEMPVNVDAEAGGGVTAPLAAAMATPEPIAPPAVEAAEAAPEPTSRPAPAATVAPAESATVEFSTRAAERATPYARPATKPAAELLQDVATDLMRLSGFPCRCEVKEGEYDLVKLIVEDRSAYVLVGRYGAAVDAVEHLVEKIATQAAGDRVRMNLDVNNFRRRREEHLVQVTRGAVREVRETGEPVHLDPLCARERRIVHLQVEDIPGLATYTVQDENGKHVVIATEEQARAAGGDAYHGHDDDAPADDPAATGAAAAEIGAPDVTAADVGAGDEGASDEGAART